MKQSNQDVSVVFVLKIQVTNGILSQIPRSVLILIYYCAISPAPDRQTKFDRITQRSEGSEVRALVSQARPGGVRTEDSSGPGAGSGMVNLMHDRRVVRCSVHTLYTLVTLACVCRGNTYSIKTRRRPGDQQDTAATREHEVLAIIVSTLPTLYSAGIE